MKLIRLSLLSFIAFSFLMSTPLMAYADRGDLAAVERYIEDVNNDIRDNRSLRDRSLMVHIKGKGGKTTTLGKYLKTARKSLTQKQLHLITWPLVAALMQKSSVVEVVMGGASIDKVTFAQTSPVDPAGASFVVVYSGNTTYPEQVFNGLETPIVK